MNIHAEYSPTAPGFSPNMPDPFPASTAGAGQAFPFVALKNAPLCWPRSEQLLQSNVSPFVPRPGESGSIYVVDDDASLIELYTIFLRAHDYQVRTFYERQDALNALENDLKGPDLLITDYLGHSMPIDRFLHRTLSAHPTLRILMASGLSLAHLRFSKVRPDRFVQKPFTAEELLMEVRAALTA